MLVMTQVVMAIRGVRNQLVNKQWGMSFEQDIEAEVGGWLG